MQYMELTLIELSVKYNKTYIANNFLQMLNFINTPQYKNVIFYKIELYSNLLGADKHKGTISGKA